MLTDMRVLIQNCDTLKFFAAENGWTSSAEEATDFKGTLAAAHTIRRSALARAQIVLQFGRPDLDIVLQLGDCKDPQRN
jgi:hypothetical protein